MDIIVAERLGGAQFGKSTEIYKFEKIKRAKAEAKKIPTYFLDRYGCRRTDRPADPGIVQILAQEAGKPENRWYADNGIPEF